MHDKYSYEALEMALHSLDIKLNSAPKNMSTFLIVEEIYQIK